MVNWEQLQSWNHLPLLEQCHTQTRLRNWLIDLGDDLRAGLNQMGSESLTITAAKQQMNRYFLCLDQMVNEASEIMMATSEAADGVWRVETQREECQQFAQINNLTIVSETEIVPGSSWASPAEYPQNWSGSGSGSVGANVSRTKSSRANELEQPQHLLPDPTAVVHTLQSMVSSVIKMANEVDTIFSNRLAKIGALTTDSSRIVPDRYVSFETRNSFSQGLPNLPHSGWSALEIASWWHALTRSEQQQLIFAQPQLIGSLDGISIEARDSANRLFLSELLVQIDAEIEEKNRLYSAAAPFSDATNTTLFQQLISARAYRDHLQSLHNTLKIFPAKEELQLINLDVSDRHLKAAVAIGNADKASHIAVLVPGMGTTVEGSMDRYLVNAQNIRRIMTEEGRLRQAKTAAVAWLDYQAPAGGDVIGTALARSGADRLNSFTEGLEAQRQSSGTASPLITILGHSYGSTTAGIATTRVRTGVVDNLVLFGSPGAGTADARNYNLAAGNAYVSGVDSHDSVQGLGPNSVFGANPMGMSGITPLSNDTPKASGLSVFWPFARHSSYLEEGTGTMMDFGLVAAGKKHQ